MQNTPYDRKTKYNSNLNGHFRWELIGTCSDEWKYDKSDKGELLLMNLLYWQKFLKLKNG